MSVISGKTSRRRLVRGLAVALALGGALAALGFSGCASFGGSLDAKRLARARQSPEWQDGRFENQQLCWSDLNAAMRKALFGRATPNVTPATPLSALTVNSAATLSRPPASGLRVTWFGHSSSLIELDGVKVLVDPLWTQRVSPFSWVGPKPWFPPPMALSELPAIDAVIISHDHYDHLDRSTIEAMRSWHNVFVVPLGIGAHLVRWGIAESRIVELDWWEKVRVGAIEVTATPSRHVSGRYGRRSNQTLWASYALVGPQHRVWYSGDTGFHREIDKIGERLGPFDVTLIESGQYSGNWPDVHLGPEQAVEAHRRVRGKALLPVHWALIQLADHAWTEPMERIRVAARCRGVEVLAPRPGESIEPGQGAPQAPWWPQLAWKTASEQPIVATQSGDTAKRVEPVVCGREK